MPESRTHKQVVRKAASQRVFEIDPAMRLKASNCPLRPWKTNERLARLADELAVRFDLTAALAIDPMILPAVQPALHAGRTRTSEGEIPAR